MDKMLVSEDKATRQIKFQRHGEQSRSVGVRKNIHCRQVVRSHRLKTPKSVTGFLHCSIYADRQQNTPNIDFLSKQNGHFDR